MEDVFLPETMYMHKVIQINIGQLYSHRDINPCKQYKSGGTTLQNTTFSPELQLNFIYNALHAKRKVLLVVSGGVRARLKKHFLMTSISLKNSSLRDPPSFLVLSIWLPTVHPPPQSAYLIFCSINQFVRKEILAREQQLNLLASELSTSFQERARGEKG